jgi:hypothetical protein
MLIRVLDFQGFDQTIDLPDDSTVATLRELLRLNFDYDSAHCVLYHKGADLPPGLVLTNSDFSDNNVIVFFQHPNLSPEIISKS